MSTRSAAYLEAIEHLPEGAILVLTGVSWQEYEELLDDLTVRPGLRVSYDGGRLEIMSPLSEHEQYKELISGLARAFAESMNLPLESYGSTTWKQQQLQKGIEPDACFYIANADRVVGKRQIDLNSDPPPDVVVEVDVTNESRTKFSIYAALGVPELWRYEGKHVQMYRLEGDSYVETESGRFLTGLSGALLTEFLEIGKTKGQTATLRLFRERLRAAK